MLRNKRKERIEVMGLLLQGFIYGNSQNLTVGGFALKVVPLVVGRTSTLGILHHG